LQLLTKWLLRYLLSLNRAADTMYYIHVNP